MKVVKFAVLLLAAVFLLSNQVLAKGCDSHSDYFNFHKKNYSLEFKARNFSLRCPDKYNYVLTYKSLWRCAYCGKEVILSVHDDPYRRGLKYGCPNNKVEGTHSWVGYAIVTDD